METSEIILKRCDGGEMVIKGFDSHPKEFPVVPWCRLSLSDSCTTTDYSVLKMITLKDSISHRVVMDRVVDIATKHIQNRSLSAIVLLTNENHYRKSLPTKLENCEVTIVAVSLDYQRHIKSFLSGQDDGSVRVSVIPLIPSLTSMLAPKSLESSQELFQMVCHVVRDGLYISTDRNLFVNFLQRIRAYCLEKDIEMYRAVFNRISEILLKRKDVTNVISRDFPAYLIFADVFERDSSMSKRKIQMLRTYVCRTMSLLTEANAETVKETIDVLIKNKDFSFESFGWSYKSIFNVVCEALIKFFGEWYKYSNCEQSFGSALRLGFLCVSIIAKLDSNRSVYDLWRNIILLQFENNIIDSIETVEEIGRSLSAMSRILDDRFTDVCTWRQLASFFLSKRHAFKFISCSLDTFLAFLPAKDLSDFIKLITNKYTNDSLTVSEKDLSVNNIREGVLFVKHLQRLMNRTDQIFEILSNWIKFLVTCIDAIPEEAGPRKVEVMTPEDDYIDEVDEMISHKLMCHFLMTSKRIPSSLKNKATKEFLEVACARSSSSVHHYIFDFILKIGQKCERMESLLVDMASLRILLSLASPDQEKFSSFLNSVVSEVVQHRDQCFQDVVCTLLEILPHTASTFQEVILEQSLKMIDDGIGLEPCSLEPVFLSILEKIPGSLSKCTSDCTINISLLLKVFEFIFQKYKTQYLDLCNLRDTTCQFFVHLYTTAELFIQLQASSPVLDNVIAEVKDSAKEISDQLSTKCVTFGSVEAINKSYCDYTHLLEVCSGYDDTHHTAEYVMELTRLFADYATKVNSLLFWKCQMDDNTVMKILLLPALEFYYNFVPCVLQDILKNLFYPEGQGNQLHYVLKETASLKNIINLYDSFSKFFSSLEDSSLETIAFSHGSELVLLKDCLKFSWQGLSATSYFSLEPVDKMKCINASISNAELLLKNLLFGEECILTVEKMCDAGIVDTNLSTVEKMNLFASSVITCNDSEVMDCFIRMKGWECSFAHFKDSISSMCKLIVFQDHFETLKKVCDQFQLQTCLKDKNMTTFKLIVEKFITEKESCPLSDCIDMSKAIEETLKLPSEKETHLCFKVLACITHYGPSLYNFAVERNISSRDSFVEQYRLVTAALNSDDTYDVLLNQLFGAMSLLFAILDKTCTLNSLLTQIAGIPKKDGRMKQLQAVCLNIDAIKLCFDSTKGESPRMVQNNLFQILKTGKYVFSCHNNVVSLFLVFVQFQISDNSCNRISWCNDQTIRFEQKLEYHRKTELNNDVAMQFRLSLDTARKVQKNYQVMLCFGCKIPTREIEVMEYLDLKILVERTTQSVTDIKKTTRNNRQEYKLLSLLSMPKMRNLHLHLQNELSLKNIIEDVGLIMECDDFCRYSQVDFLHSKLQEYSYNEECTPSKAVGGFLHHLWPNSSLFDRVLHSTKHSSSFKLFTASNFSNFDKIRAICSIFNGLPKCIQLLRCSPSTSKDDVELFFDRINNYPSLKYLLLGVNLLSLDVQQVVIKCSSELHSRVNNGALEYQLPRLCLIEYSASVFRNLPWISSDKLDLQSKECVKKYCKDVINSRFCNFDVVKGLPGSGKTFSIKKSLKGRHCTPLSIHEGFTSLKCIKWLKTANFAVFSDGVLYINLLIYMEDQKLPEALLEDIHWFFFDCFIFGYVEDTSSGLSIRFSKDSKCSVYAEVPYWDVDEQNHTDDKLQMSYNKFCEVLPVFDLLGNVKTPRDDFEIESQLLVFKYLKAFNNGCLDRITHDNNNPILIGNDKILELRECKEYLNYYLPPFVRRGNRIVENLFLSYMQKRCEFLEEFPHLKFNSGIYFDKTESINTEHMRSILFSIMLDEVYPFCDCKNAISSKYYKQLVYKHDDSAVTFELFVSHPERLTTEDKERLRSIGVTLPSLTERRNNLHLHQYLSAAFKIPLTNKGVIQLMLDEKFILTRDFFRKMLNIHERRKCRVPVIIQGETGVGKTFLVEFLSKLWNFSWLSHLKLQRKRLKEFIVQYLLSRMYYEERSTCTKSNKPKIRWVLKDETNNLSSEQNKDIVKILSSVMKLEVTHDGFVLPSEVPLEAIKAENLDMTFNKFRVLLTSSDVGNVDSFMESLFEELGKTYQHDPSFASLIVPFEVKESWTDVQSGKSEVFILIQHMFETNDREMVAPVVYSILYGGIKSTFFKFNLHAAVTPEEIESFFREVTEIASLFLHAQANYEEAKKALRDDEVIELYEDPTVTVFLDEVNTCSYPGLLKEIIVDHSINGRELQKNIFIVASCNPFRANSVISLGWFKGTYNVHPLPPSLDMLKWDYSAMQKEDEFEYITEKLKLFNPRLRLDEYVYLPRLIDNGQELIRKYAKEHLLSLNESESDAETLSSCAVSQRDIQRVFILYEWLLESFDIFSKYSNETKLQRNIRAIFVACAITYYFRLNESFRDRYEKEMDNIDKLRRSDSAITFKQALNDEMEWLLSKIKLHSRIACTKALKENVYAIVVCSMTRIPLIIIGPPGSSKTISFKFVVSNFQGFASEAKEFREQKVFKIFDPYPYQCSRASTSIEIESVFDRAINRQETLLQAGIDCCSVVLLDEAGLPEEKHESLKALHYYLDKRKVSFVAISNHVLDAAKSNRAISLYRPPTGIDDLLKLAGTFFPSILHPDQPSSELTLSLGHVQPVITENAIEKAIQSFVYAYHELATVKETENFRKFFGLRDFIHFLSYLHRKTKNDLYFEPKHVAEAVERNFNGKYFELLLQHYLNLFGAKAENVALRSTFEILQSSISDLPSDLTIENEVRYKLLIDSSEDLSLTRFLFLYKVLNRSSARVLIGTRFSGETESENKMHTISSLCYSAARGETVLLIDSEDIQECFYNLFNQQFTSISNGDGKIYFTTVSIGSNMRLCEVSPNFQCVVVVKQQALKNTQPVFLNRFEKYSISYLSIANDIFSSFPMKLRLAIENVTRELQSFVKQFEPTCFYGFTEDTITSLVLTLFSSECDKGVIDKEVEFTGTSIKYLLVKFFITFMGKQISSSMRSDVKIAFSTEILTLDTLEEDADYISSMLKNEGDAFILSEDIDELNKIIEFSVKWLMTDGIGVYSTGVKFFVTCLEKFLFLSLVKHILSIMTPEAFVIHMEKLEPYFRKVYIQKQSHFSFGGLLQEILKSRQTAKNILCFTRTSHLLHEVIPNKYFWTAGIPSTLSSQELKRLADCLQLDPEHIYKLSIYRIMATTCLKALHEVFQNFQDNYSKVLLLVADVKETSVDVINRVRLLMEDCNQQLREDRVVILLLHFPSSNFFKHCYPSLFINGWKHRYLDTIGYGSENGSVNIAEWLMQSFGLAEVSLNFIKDDDLNVWLKEILLLACGYLEIQRINAWPNTFWDRHDILKQVLFSQHVKPVLFTRFRKFWTPFLMITLSRSMAVLSARFQSTMGISDLINSAIKATFTDFILYLLFFLNPHYVFHTIQHSNEAFFDVTMVALARIIEFLPIPHSREDLKVEVMNKIIPSTSSKVTRVPAFPFFKMIYAGVEQELNRCGNEYAVRRKNIVSSDQTKMFFTQKPRHYFEEFQDELVCTLQQALTDKYEELCTFRVAVLEMENSEQLFLGYSESHKMRKFGNSSRIILRRYLLDPLQSGNIVMEISRMHIRLRVYDSNVMSPFMLSVLHIIDLLEKLEVTVNNEKWVAALTMADNSAIYSKAFTAFIEMMFRLFENLCSSPKCSSGMNSLCDIYISVTNLGCASNMSGIYNCRIINLWLLIEIGLNYYHQFYNKKNFSHIFPKLVTHFETKMEEPLKVKDVFDCVCLYGFDGRKPFHDFSFVQVLDCILNHFYVRFLYIYQAENDNLDPHCDSNETISWLLRCFDENIRFPLAEDQLQLYVCLRYFIRQLLFNDNEKSQHELSLCNSKVRNCFQKIVYDKVHETTYVPRFYHKCPNISGSNIIHSRYSLADLYFDILVENLSLQVQDIQGITELITNCLDIINKIEEDDDASQRIMLLIDKQAIIHVMLNQMSIWLAEGDTSNLVQLPSFCKVINEMFDRKSIRVNFKNSLVGHGLVLILRLLQASESVHSFQTVLAASNQYFLQDFDCVQPIKPFVKIDQNLLSSRSSHPLFQIERKHGVINKLHQNVSKALKRLIQAQSKKELMNLTSESYTKGDPKLKWGFNMVLMVVIYEEIYKPKKWSDILVSFLRESLSQFMDQEYIRVLLWLAAPQELGSPDDIISLRAFCYNADNAGHFESIIQLVAVVMGCPPLSTHLWTHLFDPVQIKGYSLPTTLLDHNKVVGNNNFYSDLLKSNDDFSCLEYTNRGTMSFQSSTFTHWANYAMLFFSILVNPQNLYKLRDHNMFPDDLKIPEYILESVREFWGNIGSYLNIKGDGRQLLTEVFCTNLYEKFCDVTVQSQPALIPYEQTLHELFLRSFNSVKNETVVDLVAKPLKQSLRYLSANMPPVYSSRKVIGRNFLLTVLSSTHLHNPDSKLFILYQYLLKRHLLNAGGILLPYLMFFYRWMHDNLSCKMTLLEASTTSFQKHLDGYLKEYFPTSRQNVLKQFEEMKDCCKVYVKSSKCGLPCITETTTVSEMIASNDESPGLLLNFMMRIIDFYNGFVTCVTKHCSVDAYLSVLCHKTDDQIPLVEVSSNNCCFGIGTRFDDINDLMPIIEKHYQNIPFQRFGNHVLDDTLINSVPQDYDMWHIQCDIIKTYLGSKMLIESHESGSDFKFTLSNDSKTDDFNPLNLIDQAWFREHLRGSVNFEDSLQQEKNKEFCYSFHSIHQGALFRVVSGLNIVLKYVVQVSSSEAELATISLHSFIEKHMSVSLNSVEKREVLAQIGIMHQSMTDIHSGITEDQYLCLCSLEIRYVLCVSEIFTHWLISGFYEFCALPFSMKTSLPSGVVEVVHRSFASEDKFKSLTDFVDLLLQMEQDIVDVAYENFEEAISVVMKRKSKPDDILLIECIPQDVQVQHYVWLLLELRKILTKMVEQRKAQSTREVTVNVEEEKSLPVEKNLKNLSVMDVSRILDEMNMTDAVKYVNDNEIDGNDISKTPPRRLDSYLAEIGLTTICQRIRFKVLFERKHTDHISEEGKACSHAEVVYFCQTTRGFNEPSIKKVDDSQLDGEMLLLAIQDDECLEEMNLSLTAEAKLRSKFPNYIEDKLHRRN